MSLHITGGLLRGRKIHLPADCLSVRPTSAVVRLALFNILGGRVPGRRFLDLFAGAGTVGLEAASRGAAPVILVERDPPIFSQLQDNLRKLTPANTSAVCLDALEYCRQQAKVGMKCHTLFADPPYAADFTPLLALCRLLLAEDGVAIFQFDRKHPPAWIGEADQVREYGGTGLGFFEVESLQ